MQTSKKIKLYSVLTIGMVILGMLFLNGCKDYLTPDYELKITIDNSIATGTPEEGTYVYQEFEQIEYNYESLDPNIAIEVVLNGSPKDPTGTFIMYRNLEAVVQLIDIRGTWEIGRVLANGEEESWIITLSGATPFSGTVTDDRGYQATWTVDLEDLDITYTDWADYEFTGNIRTMVGNWTGEDESGTWDAVRTSDSR